MDKRKEIVKTIQGMAGRYSAYEIFTDWIRCLALSIEQSTHLLKDEEWRKREQEYIDTIKKYSEEERTKIYQMTACLIDTLEDGPDDVLGDVYMKAEMGSKAAGQFFTPFHVSVLTAKLGLMEQIEAYKAGELAKIEINEPACGGGAMVLAAAKVLQESGVNYQAAMEVVAQDLEVVFGKENKEMKDLFADAGKMIMNGKMKALTIKQSDEKTLNLKMKDKGLCITVTEKSKMENISYG